jgi:hypothetical protein
MGRDSEMQHQHQHDTRTEAALYWASVSLIVCEGLSIEKAAERLGVEGEELTDILHRRQSLRPYLERDGASDSSRVATRRELGRAESSPAS